MKKRIGNKYFKTNAHYNQYIDYCELLKLPVKTQKLLFYIEGLSYNLPSVIPYYDKYEDDEKICLSFSDLQVKMGDNGFYSKNTNKSGLTIYKHKKGAQKLKIWYGSHMYTVIRTLIYFNFLNISIIKTFAGDEHFRELCTKGALNNILNGKITDSADLCMYYAQYCLKLKKDLIQETKNDLFEILFHCAESKDRLYALRSLLSVTKSKKDTIKYLSNNVSKIDDFRINGLYGNAINVLKASDKKIDVDTITLNTIENIRKNLIKKFKLFNSWHGTSKPIRFYENSIYDDLPF